MWQASGETVLSKCLSYFKVIVKHFFPSVQGFAILDRPTDAYCLPYDYISMTEQTETSGPCHTIKKHGPDVFFFGYRDSRYKDKTVVRPSYLGNGIPYTHTSKTVSLYRDGPLLLWHSVQNPGMRPPASATIAARTPSQYKDRLIYVWRFPC